MRATRKLPVAGIAGALLVLGLTAGCRATADPPPIRLGRACDACGMEIRDLRFACERRADGAWHAYDSIECLVRAGGTAAATWLADYDGGALHAADSMWVVKGTLVSPMGGGLAAFLDPDGADDVAQATRGEVLRPSDLLDTRRSDAP